MLATFGLNVLLTALLSAALTWLVAYGVYKRRLARELDSRLEQIQSEFEARVKSGVLAAGAELLPALREQVKLGFQDALRETQAGTMVEQYAGAVNRSTDALANRLGGMFGLKPRK